MIGASSAEEKNKKGEIAFTLIPLTSLPYENLYYRNGKKFTGIEIKKSKRSKPYTLSPAGFLELYIEHEDPEQKYRLIGKARLITGTRKILYFLRKNESSKKGALPIALYGIDDSAATFPDSSFRFINFINTPLLIEFNKKRFRMKPRQSTVRKLNLSGAGSFAPFIIKDTKDRTLGGRLFSHAASREMVLIFPPKKGKKRLDIRYFSD